jgi:hypothetical protein
LAEVASRNQNVLEKLLKNRKIIKLFLENVLQDKTLISLAEHYDFFDKIVLYVDKKDKFRIRLHIFSGDSSTKYRPHCHRWNYSSVILNEGYKHFIYGTEDNINEETDFEYLNAIIIREEKQGSIYTLSHKVFHSIEALPNTVSVIIRGTTVKDRFLIMDKLTRKKWWEYGRESETIEEIRKKQVSLGHIKNLIDKLYKLKVLE